MAVLCYYTYGEERDHRRFCASAMSFARCHSAFRLLPSLWAVSQSQWRGIDGSYQPLCILLLRDFHSEALWDSDERKDVCHTDYASLRYPRWPFGGSQPSYMPLLRHERAPGMSWLIAMEQYQHWYSNMRLKLQNNAFRFPSRAFWKEVMRARNARRSLLIYRWYATDDFEHLPIIWWCQKRFQVLISRYRFDDDEHY